MSAVAPSLRPTPGPLLPALSSDAAAALRQPLQPAEAEAESKQSPPPLRLPSLSAQHEFDPASLPLLLASSVAAGQTVPGQASSGDKQATQQQPQHAGAPLSPHSSSRPLAAAPSSPVDSMLLPRSLFFPAPPAVTQAQHDARVKVGAGEEKGDDAASFQPPPPMLQRVTTLEPSHAHLYKPVAPLSARGATGSTAKRVPGSAAAVVPHLGSALGSIAAISAVPVPPASASARSAHVRRTSLHSSFGPRVSHTESDPLVIAQTARSAGCGPLNRAQIPQHLLSVESLAASCMRENMPADNGRAWDQLTDMTDLETRRSGAGGGAGVGFVTAATFQMREQMMQQEDAAGKEKLQHAAESTAIESFAPGSSKRSSALPASTALETAAASAVIELPSRAVLDTEPQWRKNLHAASGYVLFVPHRHLMDDGAAVIAQLVQLQPRITKLDARANGFTPAACAAILSALPRSGVQVLDLSAMHGFPMNHLGEQGALALKTAFQTRAEPAANPPVKGCALRALRLQQIGSLGILHLISLQTFEYGLTLRVLDLRGNNIGQNSASAAEGSAPMGAAAEGGGELHVQNSNHSALAAGSAALGRTTHTFLTQQHEASLSLPATRIAESDESAGDDADDPLLRPQGSSGPVHDSLFIRLCKSLSVSRVEKLLLSHNNLSERNGGGEALVSLLSNPTATISFLDLADNSFGPRFGALMGQMLHKDSHALSQLILDSNPAIGDKGARSLCAGLLSNSTLKYLSMARCNLAQTCSVMSAWYDRKSDVSGGSDTGQTKEDALDVAAREGLNASAPAAPLLSLMGPHDDLSTSWVELLRSNQVLVRLNLGFNAFSTQAVAKLFRFGLACNQTVACVELQGMQLTDEPRERKAKKVKANSSSPGKGVNKHAAAAVVAPINPRPVLPRLPAEQIESSLVSSVIHAITHNTVLPPPSTLAVGTSSLGVQRTTAAVGGALVAVAAPAKDDPLAGSTWSAPSSAADAPAAVSAGSTSNLQVIDLRHNSLHDSFVLGLFHRVVHHNIGRCSLRSLRLDYNNCTERLVRGLAQSMSTNQRTQRHRALQTLTATWKDIRGCEMALEKTNDRILQAIEENAQAQAEEAAAHAELRATRQREIEITNTLVRELARVEAEKDQALQEHAQELVRLQNAHARFLVDTETSAQRIRAESIRERKRLKALAAHQVQVDAASTALLPLRTSTLAELARLEAIHTTEDGALAVLKRETHQSSFKLVMKSGRILRSYHAFLALYAEQARSLRVSRRMRGTHLIAYSKLHGISLADTHRLLAALTDAYPSFASRNLKYFDLHLEDFVNWFFDAYHINFDAQKRSQLQAWSLVALEHYVRVPAAITATATAQSTAAAGSTTANSNATATAAAAMNLTMMQPACTAQLAQAELLVPSALHSPAGSTAILAPSLPAATPYLADDYTHYLNLQLCFATNVEWADSARKPLTSMVAGVPLLGAVRPTRSDINKEKAAAAAVAAAAASATALTIAPTVVAEAASASEAAPSEEAAKPADAAGASLASSVSSPPVSPSPLTLASPEVAAALSPKSLSPARSQPGSPRAQCAAASPVAPQWLYEDRLLSSFDVPIGSTLLLLLKDEAKESIRIKHRVNHASGQARAPSVVSSPRFPRSPLSPRSPWKRMSNGSALATTGPHSPRATTGGVTFAGTAVDSEDEVTEPGGLTLRLHQSESRKEQERNAAEEAQATAAVPKSFYAQAFEKLDAARHKRRSLTTDSADDLSLAVRRRRSAVAFGEEDPAPANSVAAMVLAASRRSASMDPPANRRGTTEVSGAGVADPRRVFALPGPRAVSFGGSIFPLLLPAASQPAATARESMSSDEDADPAADTLTKGSGGIIRLGGGLVRTLAEDEAVRQARQQKLRKLMRIKERREAKAAKLRAKGGANASVDLSTSHELNQHNQIGGVLGGGLAAAAAGSLPAGASVLTATFPHLVFQTLLWHEVGAKLGWTIGQLVDHLCALFGIARTAVLDLQFVPGLKATMLDPALLESHTLNSMRRSIASSSNSSRTASHKHLLPPHMHSSSTSSLSPSLSAQPSEDALASVPMGSITEDPSAAGVVAGMPPKLRRAVSLQRRPTQTQPQSARGSGPGPGGMPLFFVPAGPSTLPWSQQPVSPTNASAQPGQAGQPSKGFGLGGLYGARAATPPDTNLASLGLDLQGADLVHVMSSPALEEMLQAALGEAARLERRRVKRLKRALAAREAAEAREKSGGFYANAAKEGGQGFMDENDREAQSRAQSAARKERYSSASHRPGDKHFQAAHSTKGGRHNRSRTTAGESGSDSERRGRHGPSASMDFGSSSSRTRSGKKKRRKSPRSSAGASRPGTHGSSSSDYDFAAMRGEAGSAASNSSAAASPTPTPAFSTAGMSLEEIAAATANIAREVRLAKARNLARKNGAGSIDLGGSSLLLSGTETIEESTAGGLDGEDINEEEGDEDEEGADGDAIAQKRRAARLEEEHDEPEQDHVSAALRRVQKRSKSRGGGEDRPSSAGSSGRHGSPRRGRGGNALPSASNASSSAAAAAASSAGRLSLHRGFQAPTADAFDFTEDILLATSAYAAHKAAALARAEEAAQARALAAERRKTRLESAEIGAEFLADDYEESEYQQVDSPQKSPKAADSKAHDAAGEAAAGQEPRPKSAAVVPAASSSRSSTPAAAGAGSKRRAPSASRAASVAASPSRADALRLVANDTVSLVSLRWPASLAQRLDLDALTLQMQRWGSGVATAIKHAPAPAAVDSDAESTDVAEESADATDATHRPARATLPATSFSAASSGPRPALGSPRPPPPRKPTAAAASHGSSPLSSGRRAAAGSSVAATSVTASPNLRGRRGEQADA